jgi:hypothetical protein
MKIRRENRGDEEMLSSGAKISCENRCGRVFMFSAAWELNAARGEVRHYVGGNGDWIRADFPV